MHHAHRLSPGLPLAASALALLAVPGAAHAQRAGENAVNSADDAFGSAVGLETTGIYSEFDTRGFSPVKAGNVRVEGVYFDPVGVLSGRLRQSTAIRIGFAAEDYPFQAPTGIVDHKFRPFPEKSGTSLAANLMAYGGRILEWDLRLRNKAGSVALTGGLAAADNRFGDGAGMESWGWTLRPIVRLGGAEIAPWVAEGKFFYQEPRVLTVVTGDTVPPLPPQRRYLGQTWARSRFNNISYGVTAKVPLTDTLAFRGGLGHANGDRERYFSEFQVLAPSGNQARHRLIADPAHNIHSTSGEGQLAWRFGSGAWQHRLIAGFRFRDRLTETGGSDAYDFGLVTLGEADREVEPAYRFGPVNTGRVRQSAVMLGYSGKLAGAGLINLGVQKARYRATNREGLSGVVTASRDDPWLYNATLGLDLTPALALYIGTQRGLEDSGTAPDNALNRNEQLPATRTTQYDAGLRWKFHGGQLVLNAFQITKPYFTFDAASLFTEQGDVRHRGLEASLSGHFGKRFNLVAGAVAMQPRVTGAARQAGLHGERPTGTPSLFARLDANYRTDIFGGLTPTASLLYTGPRAVSARPLASLGGKQLMLPGVATIDLGLRQQFKLGKVPMSFRLVVFNVFDAVSWKVAAPNALLVDERRRLNISLAADL